MTVSDHLLYALMWLGFGSLHSLLARPFVRRWLNDFLGRFYRLAYNTLATAHFTAIFAGGYWLFASLVAPYSFFEPAWALLLVIQWAGILVVAVALFHYDLGRFSGLSQARGLTPMEGTDEDEPLHLTGLHCYVRHPLYSGLFLFFWGSSQDEFRLATALWASAYLIVGTYFEDRDLLARHGARYASYRASVPAYLPWKGLAGRT